VEEKMTEAELWVDRITAYAGTCFGGVVSMGILVTSAIVLGPLNIVVDSFEQAAVMLVPVFGRWAIGLFAASLGIGCFGAGDHPECRQPHRPIRRLALGREPPAA
jgi:hypothetical protein